MQGDQQMHVIFHAANPIEMTFAALEHPPDEAKEVIPPGLERTRSRSLVENTTWYKIWV
jgi:hypothetical protein